ncbi:MAG: universal stress protein [Reichenbachiella sp.]|uniref:universal stress protein n=1 Tax=Reichenbachiella sp. TaxID=2184521 RepID=UPI0032972BDB
MNIINKVLIPLDFSESAINAAKYVSGMIARDRRITCILYHVSQHTNLSSDEKKLIEIKSKWFDAKGYDCEVLVTNGDFVKKLIEDQARLKVDLIVMGMAENKLKQRSFTLDLLKDANCPLMIVPQRVADFKLDAIALALDENEFDSKEGLQLFHDIAKWFNAKVHLIKVDKEGKGGVHTLKTEDTLEYYLESLDYQYSFPVNEDIEKGILNYIRDKGIDALAILPKTHAQKSEPSEGRLTKILAKHTEVPLLVLD